MATLDPTERLRAQHAHLRSDERLRERAALARLLSPSESLAETFALARWAAFLLDQLSPEERQRALDYHEPPPADAAPILRRLASASAPARGAP